MIITCLSSLLADEPFDDGDYFFILHAQRSA